MENDECRLSNNKMVMNKNQYYYAYRKSMGNIQLLFFKYK